MEKLKLFLPNEIKNSVSLLQRETMESELKELWEKHPLDENQFDFRITYIVKVDAGYEVGFFIRNAVDLDLTFDVMPMHLVDGETIIGIQMFDFKEIGAIPAMSIMPYKIIFKKDNVYDPEWLDRAELRLGIGVEFKVEYTAKTDIINLDKMNKKAEKFILDKVSELPELRLESFDYSCLTLEEDSKGNVDALILIRNGYAKPLVLQEMNFSIIDKNNLPIYKGGFKAPFEQLEAKKAVLCSLFINSNELALNDIDYEQCYLKFE